MADTLADIRTVVRALLSEPSASYWSNIELNGYINSGLEGFCNDTDILEDISTDSLVAYQAEYSLPSDCTKLKQLRLVKGNTDYLLIPQDLLESYTGIIRSTMNPPRCYNLWGTSVVLSERPSTAAQATTLATTINSTDTSIVLTSADGFPKTGRIVIENEVIKYGLATTSTETLSVVTRGAEGTTAASHTAGVAVTLRDVWFYHNKTETLASDTTEVTIPNQFTDAVAYFAASIGRRKSKDHDLAREYYALYQEGVRAGIDYARTRWRRSYSTK